MTEAGSRNRMMLWRSALLSDAGPPGGCGPRAVGAVLAEYADHETLLAWPSRAVLAERSGASRRAVRDHLTILESTGWITSVEPGGRRGGPRTTRWQLTTPATAARVDGATRATVAPPDGLTRATTAQVDGLTRAESATTRAESATTRATSAPELDITSNEPVTNSGPVEQLLAECWPKQIRKSEPQLNSARDAITSLLTEGTTETTLRRALAHPNLKAVTTNALRWAINACGPDPLSGLQPSTGSEARRAAEAAIDARNEEHDRQRETKQGSLDRRAADVANRICDDIEPDDLWKLRAGRNINEHLDTEVAS